MGSPQDQESFGFKWRYALLVFILALAYRSFYLFEASGRPDFNLFYMDQEFNLEWAKSLASGKWHAPFDQLRDQAYFRAPLYSHLLAGVIILFGEGTLIPRIFQIVLGSVSCALAYAVAARCYGQRIGMVTGLICALYWVFAYFDSEFLLPVLLVFLILLGLLLLFMAVERGSVFLAAIAGLMLGLFSITRPNILAFFPFVIVWGSIAVRDYGRGRATMFAALLAIGCLLPPAAATLRNHVVADDFVVVASQGGVNFYIGNNPESNGMQAIVPGTRGTWWGGFEDTRAIAEDEAGRPLKPSEISNFWYRQAFAYIADQPADWLRLLSVKTLALIGDAEPPNNEPYEARRNDFMSLRVPLSFGVLFGLFLVSLPFQIRSSQHKGNRGRRSERLGRRFVWLILMFVLVYAATFVAFFVNGRYRVPLVPFVAMGAAFAIVTLINHLNAGRLKRGVAMLVVSIILIALLRVDSLGIRADSEWFVTYNSAVDKIDLGDLDGGIEGLETVRADGVLQEPEFYGTLIRAYASRNAEGDRRKILDVAEEGLRHNPDSSDLLWFAMIGHLEMRDWPNAMTRAEQYLLQVPDDLTGIYVAFRATLVQNRRHEAELLLERADKIDAGHRLVVEMRSLMQNAKSQVP